MKKTIEVVAAIIKIEDQFYCAKRADYGELARKWEFPGGKIEAHETQQEALKRELEEELNINVDVGEHFLSVNHEYNTFKLILHSYICEYDSFNIVSNEHLDSKWLKVNELNTLDWAAADVPIVDKLIKVYGPNGK